MIVNKHAYTAYLSNLENIRKLGGVFQNTLFNLLRVIENTLSHEMRVLLTRLWLVKSGRITN